MKSQKRREITSLVFTCLCIAKSLLIHNFSKFLAQDDDFPVF